MQSAEADICTVGRQQRAIDGKYPIAVMNYAGSEGFWPGIEPNEDSTRAQYPECLGNDPLLGLKRPDVMQDHYRDYA
jgi:hypothetical protein